MTITEILVAFSIMMVGVVMLIPVGVSSMQRTQQAQEQRQAWAHATHLSKVLSLQEAWDDRQTTGTFEDTYHYVIDYEEGTIKVSWFDSGQREHFVTLHAAYPH